MICLCVICEWHEKFVQKVVCHTHVKVKFKLSCTIANFKYLKFTCISSASQPACQPAIIPSCARCMALEFLHSKGNHITVVPKNFYPLCHGASFYPLLLSFHLQIAYRKGINLQIGVDNLVGKVLIDL